MRRIGLQDCYVDSGSNDYLLEKFGLSAAAVAATVRDMMVPA